MPSLVTPALPAGTLAALTQPTIPGDGGLRLRPWRAADAPTGTGFHTPHSPRHPAAPT
ncbi:hypothetical protein AB0H83_39520 [Dactylosporangium sp. NPDC050688]|uniref:hypothetical protein n=1 Tax=Dactylosporangium sp. NPDC050688 TaxID=3157217 RepID=UPI0033E36150